MSLSSRRGDDYQCSPAGQQHTVRVFTKAEQNYSLTIRNCEVVLAPANPDDEYQHWIKDLRYSTRVKDEEGFPSFALVNKATGQAIKHSIGPHHPVRLVPYNPEYLDESVLWSESTDLGDGFRCIRMVNNITLNFDAFHGDEDHGGVRDGTPVVLYEWFKGDNQRWKIEPYGQEIPGERLATGDTTMRIYTKAGEDYSLTVRDGHVVLAPANPSDEYQHWYKDMRYSTTVKDEEGFPSFALVNKATGQAIKHAVAPHHPVRLVPYNPDYLDESVLWTESNDLGDGFRCIRMVNNIALNFDAFHGDKDHGGVRDGTTVVLYEWFKGSNQRWKIVPYGQEDIPHELPPTRHPTVRVYTKAADDFSLTVRDERVVLAPADPSDEYQHWIKDMRFSTTVKDEEGFPSFALINKVTGQALKHSMGPGKPVQLIPYNPDYLDESILWTESNDLGDGFRCIRMVNNIRLNFDAFHGDEDHGGVQDGTILVLYEWFKGANQRWKIVPYYQDECAGCGVYQKHVCILLKRGYLRRANDYPTL